MNRAWQQRILIWTVVAVAVVIGLAAALWPRSTPVDIATVSTGTMRITVDDEGVTRINDVFIVSAPTTGFLRRIELEPGDSVLPGETLVAEIEPSESTPLDPRTAAEAKASLRAAESAEALARADLEKARAELAFAEAEVQRYRELARDGTVSRRDLDAAERSFDTSRAALAVAHAQMQVRSFELAQAKAHVLSPDELRGERQRCDCLVVMAPVSGHVLQVHRESAGPVTVGEALLEIGNLERLEIVVDLLSIDAVQIRPGDAAFIENWGGEHPLEASVRRVEPFGFTKVSALGIEEQRVNVVLDLLSPRSEWQALGHGYQVDVSVVLWSADDVIKVPLTALFRSGSDWALFVRENGRAEKRLVTVGRRNNRDAEIVAGLTAGEQIVVYPGESIEAGMRIAAR